MKLRITMIGTIVVLLSVNMMAQESGGSVSVIGGGTIVDGDTSLFRAHHWKTDSVMGGIENINWSSGALSFEGRAIGGENDAEIALDLALAEDYFLRFGFENFQKRFEDTGGYYTGMNPDSYSLDRDLDMDIGKVWLEFGREVEDGISFLLGYEYSYKNGDKSILGWNTAKQGGTTKYIHPSTKHIDEQVHIIKVDVSTDIDGLAVEDNFRFEIYDNSTERSDLSPQSVSGVKGGSEHPVSEDFDHTQFLNALSGEKWLNDWLFVSAGYLYVNNSGGADFSMQTIPGGGAHDKFYTIKKSDLDKQSHVVSLGAFMTPIEDLIVSLGVQAESSEADAYSDHYHSHAAGEPVVADELIADTDTTELSLEESLEIRYTGIAYTVLYAEGSFEQRTYKLNEELRTVEGNHQELKRDSDSNIDDTEGTVGVTVSPTSIFSVNAYYKTRVRNNDIDNKFDEELRGDVGEGYSAFIKMNELSRDEIGAKITYRPCGWLKTSLRYRMIDSTRESETEPAVSAGVPGGRLTSMDYQADAYLLSAAIAATDRIYISTTLSVRETRTKVPGLNAPKILDEYTGDVNSLLLSGTFLCTDDTDLRMYYSIADVNNSQDDAFPGASDYITQSLSGELSHKFSDTVRGKIQYVFDRFEDHNYNSVGETYTAHGIFAGMTKVF